MSIRFMPEASDASMEQYRPAKIDVMNELTRDTRSQEAYVSGSRRAMRAIFCGWVSSAVSVPSHHRAGANDSNVRGCRGEAAGSRVLRGRGGGEGMGDDRDGAGALSGEVRRCKVAVSPRSRCRTFRNGTSSMDMMSTLEQKRALRMVPGEIALLYHIHHSYSGGPQAEVIS